MFEYVYRVFQELHYLYIVKCLPDIYENWFMPITGYNEPKYVMFFRFCVKSKQNLYISTIG